jgi:DNA-binding MarR family transcriptional regulator
LSNRLSTLSDAPDRESIARADDHRSLRIWLRLLTCTQLIERQVRSRLREQFSTTLPRFDLMAQLARHPEGLKMNELSRLLMVTGGNVTTIVDQLEKEGLVERVDEPADRRAFRIHLTRGGERTFAEMAAAHEHWVVELFAGMTRREQDELLKLLAKVKQHAVEVAS